MKFFSGLVLAILLVAILWVGFALWTGIYSLYSIPPSKDDVQGATLLVSREPGEPVFNSIHYRPAVKDTPRDQKGIQFGSAAKPHKAVSDRIILKLPFIQWAYQNSLEPQKVY